MSHRGGQVRDDVTSWRLIRAAGASWRALLELEQLTLGPAAHEALGTVGG
jgi:hypothetical protein